VRRDPEPDNGKSPFRSRPQIEELENEAYCGDGRIGLEITMISSNTFFSGPTSIVIRQRDADLLHSLAVNTLLSNPRAAGALLDELRRAEIRSDDQVADDVVGLGSWVTFMQRNQPPGNPQRVQLVTPTEADPKEGRISVMSTLGAGLIGLKAGQSIDWPDRRGGRQLLAVLEVGWFQDPQPPGPIRAGGDPHTDTNARSPEYGCSSKEELQSETCDRESGGSSPPGSVAHLSANDRFPTGFSLSNLAAGSGRQPARPQMGKNRRCQISRCPKRQIVKLFPT
jgi:regulator of nucleoside diphosphate kinase